MPLSLLPLIFENPSHINNINSEQWNAILIQARSTQCLGQLEARLNSDNLLSEIPEAVFKHLKLARITAQRRAEAAIWEVDVIRRAIHRDTPVILLKGCAYLAAKDSNSEGRFFSDIDVLVPRLYLGNTEAALMAAGWLSSNVNAYDQHYYREWSHEVPPMEHVRRHTIVDLHHAIIPPISRYSVPTELLLEALEECSPGIYTLSRADRVIHCAIHLIQEGEASKIFRDLYDLYSLLKEHYPEASDREKLYDRAQILGLRKLVTSAANAAEVVFSPNKKKPPHSYLTDILISVANTSHPSTEQRFFSGISRIALLAHSHWMKMPLNILIPHLARKTAFDFYSKKEPDSL